MFIPLFPHEEIETLKVINVAQGCITLKWESRTEFASL